jgi:hypothetical protein
MKRYPGVSPFTAEQSNIFYGRENDIDKLQKLISLRKQVLLYSKSGIGKTSLLNAGVLPKLEDKFTILKIRFFAYNQIEKHNPLESVFEAIRSTFPNFNDLPQTILDELVDNIDIQKSLWFQFKNIHLTKPTKFILVFDQFEELFSYPAEQIESFKNQFHELIYIDVPDSVMQLIANKSDIEEHPQMDDLYEKLDVKTIFAIRSDRLSLLNNLTDKIPDIQKTFYELNPLDLDQAKYAITNPASNKNKGQFETEPFTYNSNAVNTIISALSNNGLQPIENTQLQIVCQRIEAIARQKQAETLDKNPVEITKNDLPEFKNIFLNFYEESVNETKEPELARKFIEDQLIRSNQRISLDSIICTDFVKSGTLQTLENAHLLRAERNSVGGLSYELSHDTLIEPILESGKIRKEKEEEARAEAERQEELRIEREKSEKERIERQKDRKRQKQIVIIVSIAAAVSIGFGIFGFVNMNKANDSIRKLLIRDAQNLIDAESYKGAENKYKELLNYSDTTQAIYKRINECIYLDSISKIFNKKDSNIDSLIKFTDFESLKKVNELLKQNETLDYKPGGKRILQRKGTLKLQINSLVHEKIRLAEMLIGQGIVEDAISIINNLEELNPENTDIIEFKKKNFQARRKAPPPDR